MMKKMKEYRRIVVKIGYEIMVEREKGMKSKWMERMGKDIEELKNEGVEVMVV